MDESGTHDESEFASLAGYVDHSDRWAEFENEWKAVLARYCVEEFHLTDFENRYKEFAWQNYWFLPDRELRHPLLRDLIKAIDPPSRLRVGATISIRDYHNIIPDSLKLKFHPYYFLFAKCVEQLWRVSFLLLPPGEQLAFVFDHKLGFEGRSDAIFLALKRDFPYTNRMGTVQFAPSRDCVPLQAADLVAFEYPKYGEMIAHQTGRPVRWTMVQLCKKGARGLMHQITARFLKNWVARRSD
jgi:Protein of unknown function (DUF3800)